MRGTCLRRHFSPSAHICPRVYSHTVQSFKAIHAAAIIPDSLYMTINMCQPWWGEVSPSPYTGPWTSSNHCGNSMHFIYCVYPSSTIKPMRTVLWCSWLSRSPHIPSDRERSGVRTSARSFLPFCWCMIPAYVLEVDSRVLGAVESCGKLRWTLSFCFRLGERARKGKDD